jgi:segregation and condensation protein A
MFEGPLDLLLYLIKKNDIDIYDIPIAEITDQYMEYIEAMKTIDLNVVGDFLVMAATLMHIKSKMLLPPDPLAEEDVEEDPRDELVRRLEEYKRFKEIAEELKQKESSRQDLFPRTVDEATMNELKEDAKEVLIEATLFDLINALSLALKKVPEKTSYQITQEEFTVEQKIHAILHILIEEDSINLVELFSKAHDKMEIVVTFMAVLELIRLKEILCVQRRMFDEIVIQRNLFKEAPAVASNTSNADAGDSQPPQDVRSASESHE